MCHLYAMFSLERTTKHASLVLTGANLFNPATLMLHWSRIDILVQCETSQTAAIMLQYNAKVLHVNSNKHRIRKKQDIFRAYFFLAMNILYKRNGHYLIEAKL